MPNHVTNRIKFSGDPKRIRAIMEEIKNDEIKTLVLKNGEEVKAKWGKPIGVRQRFFQTVLKIQCCRCALRT